MKYSFILIVLSKVMNPFLGNTIGICSNTSIGEPLKCCPNYRRVGETCDECWPGTYGINCIPCPTGFYGRLCRMSCHNLCTPCDPVTGCTEKAIENRGRVRRTQVKHNDNEEDILSDEITINSGKIICASLGGFAEIVGVFIGFLIWRKRFKTCLPNIHVYDQSANPSNGAFEEQHDYDALQKNGEYEEVVTGKRDHSTESVQQINSVQNMYIEISG